MAATLTSVPNLQREALRSEKHFTSRTLICWTYFRHQWRLGVAAAGPLDPHRGCIDGCPACASCGIMSCKKSGIAYESSLAWNQLLCAAAWLRSSSKLISSSCSPADEHRKRMVSAELRTLPPAAAPLEQMAATCWAHQE